MVPFIRIEVKVGLNGCIIHITTGSQAKGQLVTALQEEAVLSIHLAIRRLLKKEGVLCIVIRLDPGGNGKVLQVQYG